MATKFNNLPLITLPDGGTWCGSFNQVSCAEEHICVCMEYYISIRLDLHKKNYGYCI